MRAVLLGVTAAALVVVVGFVALLFVAGGDEGDAAAPVAPEAASALVREDSHVLGERGTSDVEVVEFLDFECEACAAAYPVVEDMRERYAGEVTFVLRYFPLPGHPNSENAAVAVEAAARQGALEAMYQRMYETQSRWSHQQQSQAPVFRGFADELGLDLAQYDADVADPEVLARVQADVDDGTELGVSGTPTFFVAGEQVRPETVEDFYASVDAALAAQ